MTLRLLLYRTVVTAVVRGSLTLPARSYKRTPMATMATSASAPQGDRSEATVTSGSQMPVWFERLEKPQFQALAADTSCDVCIVGGGISGLTSAYLMAKDGLDVVLLEDGDIASGESGRSTGHLMSWLDDRYTVLQSMFGKDGATLAASSNAEAISLIERLVRTEKIDCGFTRLNGYLFNPGHDKFNTKKIEEELRASTAVGLRDVQMIERAPIKDYDTGPAIRFGFQGQFNPPQYCAGLALAAQRNGARIFTRTRVTGIKGDDNGCEIETANGIRVSSRFAVEATNVPITNKLRIHAKQETYRTYVIAAEIPRSAIEVALFWDLEEPYHYVRTAPVPGRDDVLHIIVGGEDHQVATYLTDYNSRYERLEQWARQRWPQMGPVTHRWSGQIIEPIDHLGYIGPNPGDSENVLIVTGDSGTGLTNGTIAGMLLTDIVRGRENPWRALYNPSRFPPVSTLPHVLQHDVSINMAYADKLRAGDVQDIEDIAPCQGAIVRRGLSQYAVYRDKDGTLHACSAKCTHLGGTVRWNPAEKSFDCPIHGSRFDAYGAVLNGPAVKDLEKADPSKL